MKITEIAGCKKNKNRVNVYVDGEFAFALYLETAIQYGLKKDMDIAGLDLKRITEDDEEKFAMDAALKYISYQMRSESEVLKKLKQKGVSESAAGKAVLRLREIGYLDDMAYAKAYASELKERMGSRGIIRKFYEKGIDKELAEEVLRGLGEFSKTAALQAEKLFEKYKDLDKRKAREKVFQTLMRRGFEIDDIRQAVRRDDEF
jgi:regulatory protein